MSEWSHLANAKHIDRIIDHVTANPEAWDAAVRDAAKWAAKDAAYDAAWDAAWDAAYDAPGTGAQFAHHLRSAAACDAAWDAILALVAWDWAGGLMDLPAEQVKVLALLGDQTAILMYPAIKIMETTQELA